MKLLRAIIHTVLSVLSVLTVLFVPCLITGATARGESLPAPLPLDWCLERARDANPTLAAKSAAAEAAHQRVPPAGALEDPRFGYEASNIPTGDFDFGSTPLSGHQLGLRPRFPIRRRFRRQS